VRTVYYTGTWDLLHIGHVNALRQARELGDRLVVGVCTDKFVSLTKRDRPVIPFHQRCGMLRAIRYVDIVVAARGYLDFDAIDQYGVTVRAVGPDYARDPSHEEAIAQMKGRGIEIVCLPRTPNVSTTAIIERIRNG
jgi:glycerol-3-phosphate cytidylyltransferase